MLVTISCVGSPLRCSLLSLILFRVVVPCDEINGELGLFRTLNCLVQLFKVSYFISVCSEA